MEQALCHVRGHLDEHTGLASAWPPCLAMYGKRSRKLTIGHFGLVGALECTVLPIGHDHTLRRDVLLSQFLAVSLVAVTSKPAPNIA